MEQKIRKKKKALVSAQECVACGCCIKVCPRNAIEIWKGIMAKIHMEKCIGCGLCTTKCEFDAIHLSRDLPDASRMTKSEDKLKKILPYMIKREIKIKFNKDKK